MKIKIHTLIKGIIWELLGCIMLTAYTWYQTDLSHALNIGLVYPIVRGILWYPYERTYKHIRRRKYKSGVNRDRHGYEVRSNGSINYDNYKKPLNIYGDTE